ncbi:MAG: glycosyltransferase family 4 protein [Gaiellales bacterium]
MAPRLVTFGRLSPVKNIELMIQAVERLAPAVQDVSLDIIGGPAAPRDQDYVTWLKGYATSLGVEGRVRFLGPRPPAEVAPIVRKSSISLNLSDTGSMDKAILESAASGVPVVTSNAAARRLVASRGLGFLAIEPTPSSLEAAIRNLLDSDRHTLATRVWREIAGDHRLDLFVQRLALELGRL